MRKGRRAVIQMRVEMSSNTSEESKDSYTNEERKGRIQVSGERKEQKYR